MVKIRHRLKEMGDTLQVLNKHQASENEKVTFLFKLKDGERAHTLAVREKGHSELCPTFFTRCDPHSVTVYPGDTEPREIRARVIENLPPGDYLYEIVELVDGDWKPVLDPILEIEGGDFTPVPKLAVAVAVGLLAGFLAHKALK